MDWLPNGAITTVATIMISVMYPLGNGSKLKNFELKMSLRSVEKHLSNVDQVVVVGEKPDWIQNVIHIPAKDETGIPDYNIMQKTERALQDFEKVLHIHDDHFLLNDFDAQNFPYFYDDTLENYIKRRGMDIYGKRSSNTMTHLKNKNLPTKFFDIHTPIIYERSPFFENVVSLPWSDYKEGFVLKSLYANALKIEGEPMKDFKSLSPPQMPCKIFSSQSHLRASVQRFLLEQFPKKSKYERG